MKLNDLFENHNPLTEGKKWFRFKANSGRFKNSYSDQDFRNAGFQYDSDTKHWYIEMWRWLNIKHLFR